MLNEQNSFRDGMLLQNFSRMTRDNQYVSRAINKIPLKDAGASSRLATYASTDDVRVKESLATM